MSNEVTAIVEYIKTTQFAILATIDRGAPVQRTIASFGNVGTTLFFATRADTRKVAHISTVPKVSLLLQHEGQSLDGFVNVAIQGEATRLSESAAIAEAIEAISSHSPRFAERVRVNGTEGQAFFRIDPHEVRVLDFSRGIGAAAVSVIQTNAA